MPKKPTEEEPRKERTIDKRQALQACAHVANQTINVAIFTQPPRDAMTLVECVRQVQVFIEES